MTWSLIGSMGGNTVSGALRHSERHRDKVKALRRRFPRFQRWVVVMINGDRLADLSRYHLGMVMNLPAGSTIEATDLIDYGAKMRAIVKVPAGFEIQRSPLYLDAWMTANA